MRYQFFNYASGMLALITTALMPAWAQTEAEFQLVWQTPDTATITDVVAGLDDGNLYRLASDDGRIFTADLAGATPHVELSATGPAGISQISRDGRYLIATDTFGFFPALYTTNDGGQRWQQQSIGPEVRAPAQLQQTGTGRVFLITVEGQAASYGLVGGLWTHTSKDGWHQLRAATLVHREGAAGGYYHNMLVDGHDRLWLHRTSFIYHDVGGWTTNQTRTFGEFDFDADTLIPHSGIDGVVRWLDTTADGGSIALAGDAAIYRLEPDATAWKPFATVDIGDTSARVSTMAMDADGTFYAAMVRFDGAGGHHNLGVHVSTDQGVSWSYAGLADTPVVAIWSYNRTGYAATEHGIHVLKKASSASTDRSDVVASSGGLQLGDAWPNPAASTVAIPVRVESAADVVLQVMDIHGRVVQTVVDGYLTGGDYTFTLELDGDGFRRSGTYLYVLRTGSRVLTRRFTVLR